MSTFVLVHGGWAGAWQWRAVAKLLQIANHEVFTPTLTGLGERVHLANPNIDLETHIQDILGVLKYENLHEVILTGYSYSGMVITGVADRVPERLAHLVYVDAYVPEDGQSLADLLGPETVTAVMETARKYGDGWRLPYYKPDSPQRTDQLIKPGFQPVRIKNPVAVQLQRTFIYCTLDRESLGPLFKPITQAATKIRADPHWQYRELASSHNPIETMPQEVTRLLLEIVNARKRPQNTRKK